jgi:hypothetical protein
VVYRRDFRVRTHALIPLVFFAAAAVRIVWRGGMTEGERWALIVTGTLYAGVLAAVFVLEGRRRVVTDEAGLERRGRAPFRVAWADVEELRERYQSDRILGVATFKGGLELVSAGGTHSVDAGWQGYRELVRECAERTTEGILARLEPRLTGGVSLVFGAVTVTGDHLVLNRRSGPPLRVPLRDVSGLRLHQGWLVFYLRDQAKGARGWVARRLGELSNPYVLIELLLRHGAGRAPGPPPVGLDTD